MLRRSLIYNPEVFKGRAREEVSWSGDPELNLGHLITFTLTFLIAPGLLIAFAISRIKLGAG
jgi:hypothetical protein